MMKFLQAPKIDKDTIAFIEFCEKYLQVTIPKATRELLVAIHQDTGGQNYAAAKMRYRPRCRVTRRLNLRNAGRLARSIPPERR